MYQHLQCIVLISLLLTLSAAPASAALAPELARPESARPELASDVTGQHIMLMRKNRQLRGTTAGTTIKVSSSCWYLYEGNKSAVVETI
jgi:hypothetical protein